MAKSLNFNTLKKQYLNVTLSDENETVLMIGTPTKTVIDKLRDLNNILASIDDTDVDTDFLNDLYDTCAKIMSRNKGGIKITGEHLADCLDYEDIIIFFNAYTNFVDEVIASKN